MSNYKSLKTTIDANIKQNGRQEITGQVLNSVLNQMVTTLGAGYQFAGVATPTNPGTAQTPDYKCFYLATTPGTYTNLGGLVVADGEVAILKYDSSWTKEVTGIATADQLNQLGQEINNMIGSDIVDFSICDENGNRILYVQKGEIKTKDFDSSKVPYADNGDNAFSITDKENNDILIIDKCGNIRTKNFANKKYLKRGVTGKSCFTVQVDVNSPSVGDTTNVQDSEDNKLDHGYIILPTNYSNVGEKTRLVIICHGVGASYSDYISDTITPFDVIDVFVNMGYAVMDMYGMPTGVVADNNEVHYGAPFVLRSYKKGYDYVMQNYNLKEDGVFVVGVSMGGLSSFEIVQSGIFPVIAQVGFCPCIDLFKQAFCNNFGSREQLCELYNFEGTEPTWTSNKPPTDAEVNYFISNFSKIIGYCPIIKNVVSGDISVIFNHIPTPIDVNNFPTDEEADYETLTASYSCPLLIIHCLNDNVVAYRYSKYFIDMVKRSGGLAQLRTYPTGGHGSWDVGTSVQMVSVNGEQFSVPGSVYEAYLFINRLN